MKSEILVNIFSQQISKANKGIGIIKRVSYILPRKSLITIYKSFTRQHLDYCDVINDQPKMKVFVPKLNEYSTMLPLLLLVQEEELFNLSCTKNWVLNP